MLSFSGTGFHIINRLEEIVRGKFELIQNLIRFLVKSHGIDDLLEPILGSPGSMLCPFSIKGCRVINSDQIPAAALVIDQTVHADVGIDHGDAFSRLCQRSTTVHDHVPMQCHRIAWSRKFWCFHPITRRRFPLFRKLLRFHFGSHKIFKPSTTQRCWITDHHHIIKRDGVVMPLIHSLFQFAGLIIQVPQVNRHGVG